MASKLAFRISRNIERTGRPPIPQAYKWAEAYVSTPARPLLDMSQGVPGIPPPRPLLELLGAAASSASTCGYVPNAGERLLREAVVKEMKYVYGEDTDVVPEDISITAGCNMAFAAAVSALADAGDEIILPVPWYFNHEMTLSMLGVNTVVLKTSSEEGFMPSPERCVALITPKTKAIVLVSPNNPTGAIYPPSLIFSFAKLARANNIALIIDETYRDFITSGVPHHLFSPSTPSTPDPHSDSEPWSWRTTFIHLYSFSKAYCIPGHRVGLVCASPTLQPALHTALDNFQICAPRPPQLALAPLLTSLRPFVRGTADALAARHKLFHACLPRAWHVGAQGGYYAFVRHPFKGVRAQEVCRRLAQEMGVVCLPAGFFGPRMEEGGEGGEEERWIRFSVANVDDEKVKRVCLRLREAERVFEWEVESHHALSQN
ncbi:hypothetical protein CERSUDRAFT_151007 [Gelatoporia subvermispora B]|uniref:Aminotransferase class I/classII large domain-containing protein n=1 Tax=Ceriporiopsis subvermispora (strain B) TaxID=914234 RepID=M2RNR1_CERS8|nr:hypothetical protein CERSUDRAFT_151007 [Gelatoporia subvermispora B]